MRREDEQNLTAALVRMGLAEAGETVTLTSLTGGVSSLIVRAETSRGAFCVKQALATLRTAVEWHAPVERNRAEAEYLKLAAKLVPGAVPRLLAEDREGNAFAMELFEPSRFANWKAQLRDGVADPRVAAALGKLLATIHAATADDPKVALEFAHNDWFRALRLDPYFGTAAARHPDCAPALERLIATTATTKRALVHGDPSPKNVLVGAAGPVLLDAECAWFGDPAFDLAFALHHLLLKCVWHPAQLVDYLRCFDALAENYLRGVNWEPAAQLEGRAAALVPGLLLARVDGTSPAEYLIEARDKELARAFGRRFLLEPVSSLASLRAAWNQEMTK